MAQSTTTVTPPNPTPPTNFGSGYANTGPTTKPPNVAFVDAVYGTLTPGGDPWHPGVAPNSVPPYLDDGTAAAGTAFAAPNSGAASEGAGTEVVVTQTYPSTVFNPAGPLQTVSDLGSYVGGANSINAQHASSLSPATNPALASISPTSTTSGGGTVALTCTGTNFTRQSVIYVNGVAQTTTYVSATSLTATVTKKATAGTWPVTVVTGGAVVTAPQTLTFT